MDWRALGRLAAGFSTAVVTTMVVIALVLAALGLGGLVAFNVIIDWWFDD